jgi:putative ABC transport system ATP-binding protein
VPKGAEGVPVTRVVELPGSTDPITLKQVSSPAPGTLAPVAAVATVNVFKDYGSGETRVSALRGINVNFAAQWFTAIMGPSGSGKSTLMHCLAGLDNVTSGQVWLGSGSVDIAPIELSALSDKRLTQVRRDRIGFVFQQFNLLPTLTAAENIRLPMDIAGHKVDEAWFDTVVSTLGLGDRLKHRPTELSGGQNQRVACARALVSKPSVIFADEPTGNLDSKASAEVLGFLQKSVRELGQTVIMVTHDPSAAAYSDQAIFMADGQFVDGMMEPTADAVLDRMKSLDAAALLAPAVEPV